MHKQLLQLLWQASYADKRQMPTVAIAAGDSHRPAPVRDTWPRVALRLDYRSRLGAIQAPTLVAIGDNDYTRIEHAAEMYRLIPNATLAVLPNTTHMTIQLRGAWLEPMMVELIARAA